MPTIHRQHGPRFAIFSDDHEPAHVHVFGDGEMKVLIGSADELPRQVYAIGIKVRDRRRAMAVILERQAVFLARWKDMQEGWR